LYADFLEAGVLTQNTVALDVTFVTQLLWLIDWFTPSDRAKSRPIPHPPRIVLQVPTLILSRHQLQWGHSYISVLCSLRSISWNADSYDGCLWRNWGPYSQYS